MYECRIILQNTLFREARVTPISSFNLNELKYNKRETCHPCNPQVMSSSAAGALGGLLAKSKLGFSEIEKSKGGRCM